MGAPGIDARDAERGPSGRCWKLAPTVYIQVTQWLDLAPRAQVSLIQNKYHRCTARDCVSMLQVAGKTIPRLQAWILFELLLEKTPLAAGCSN